MTAIGSVRLHLSVLRASLALFMLAAGVAAAQPCPPGTTIPNFRFVSATQTFPREITYAWNVPAGASAGTTYEFLRAEAADYCSALSSFSVIA